ncbi:hypothetical protein C1646_759110 [Rhizophagus diaphanus]|nr:hypothetical protein C1646_759110 [Rhizophagus diaphanus] [Rhizophagus sp. MUCL 43196]
MKLTLEDAKQIALSRHGQCLSTNGTWCPFCYRYKREQLCREIVAKYLGPSENRRPDFLKIPEHPKGLDIPYCEYGFAIEQQERDQLKKELCEENCIALRYVWYYEDSYVVIPEHLRELGLVE